MLVGRPASRSLVLTLVLAAGLITVGPGSARAADDPSCTEFQNSVEDGPTTIKAHGSTRFQGAGSNQGGLGGGTLTWNMKGVVSGPNTGLNDGDISGFLNFTIDWDAPRPNTTFSSECVWAVHTAVGFLVTGRYEGAIQNYPFLDTARAELTVAPTAVAILTLDRVAPRRADLTLTVESGGQCQKQTGDLFSLSRDNSRALGDKTGNGGRDASCGL